MDKRNSLPKGTWLQGAMPTPEVRSSQSALLSSPVSSTSDSRESSGASHCFLGVRELQALYRAGQEPCRMAKRTHEGTLEDSSNLGDNSIYFIGVLGEFKHDDEEEEDNDDNMMMTILDNSGTGTQAV